MENVAYREAVRLENIRLQKAGENKLPNYLTDKKNKEDLDSRFKKDIDTVVLYVCFY